MLNKIATPLKLYAVLILLVCVTLPANENSLYRNWETVGGDPGITRYSNLDQINTTNVSQLEVALDAATGMERWRFSDPGEIEKGPDTNQGQCFGLNRGVAYWRDCDDKRILYSRGFNILAVNADTGELISQFGENGRVDLRNGLSRPPLFVGIANPAAGVIYKDLLIVGSRGNSPGHVRAYNVRTGKMKWIFNLIPHPGDRFEETWPEGAWNKVYGANVWGGLSVDVRNGLVFCATSSPKPDLFGWLYPGKNDLANSVVALDASTGEYVWHFQEIKHGIWDLDLPAPPMLVTVERDGKQVDAVAQVSKTGNTYLLDRLTGESLFPLVERPAPASDIAYRASMAHTNNAPASTSIYASGSHLRPAYYLFSGSPYQCGRTVFGESQWLVYAHQPERHHSLRRIGRGAVARRFLRSEY